MLLFASAATAATVSIGWPCGRLNWAWRNVWSTCSINSYLPSDVTTADLPAYQIRKYPVAPQFGPLEIMTGIGANWGIMSPGVQGPASGTVQVPQTYCAFAAATDGANKDNYLRNRCRRAVDAYGAITKACSAQPATLGVARGPVSGSGLDWEPAAQHVPHLSNVGALTAHYRHCFVEKNPVGLYRSPDTTCPGLLGWFTVVYNACSFNAYTPAIGATAADAPKLTPLGGNVHPVFAPGAGLNNFILCDTAAAGPAAWQAKTGFRTTRCRKALDQFGRTAYRCRTQPNTPSRIGANDALINMYDGTGTGNVVPMSLAKLVPVCNV